MQIDPSIAVSLISVAVALLGVGITLIGVGVATYAIISENRRSRFLLGVDVVLRLDERFYGETIKRFRRRAAEEMLHGTYEHLDDVLDFFELVAVLVQRKIVDAEVVYSLFYNWVDGYLCVGKPRIEQECKTEPGFYEDVIALQKTLSKFEKPPLEWTPEEVKKFLEAEAHLP